MKTEDLDYILPPEKIACEPKQPSRILLAGSMPREISKTELFDLFQVGDLLVINETRVLPRRIFFDEHEILFLQPLGSRKWSVLFQSKKLPLGSQLTLPKGLTATLTGKGKPQILELSDEISEDYFDRNAELALPPYIQEARGQRIPDPQDRLWYQSAWANHSGSLAAPTASLHFTLADLEVLRHKRVQVEKLTLHVGLGTFLPVRSQSLSEHKMHAEEVFIPNQTWKAVMQTQQQAKRVWAMGTTVARALESVAANKLSQGTEGFVGQTDLFIYPPYCLQVVSGLLTNFHQPKSTLLGLVTAFADLQNVRKSYEFALANEFRFLSYGDLSVWLR